MTGIEFFAASMALCFILERLGCDNVFSEGFLPDSVQMIVLIYGMFSTVMFLLFCAIWWWKVLI